MREDILQRYKKAEGPLPKTMLIWPLYGAGFEKLGREGKPVHVSMPQYGPEELLVRHDAVGLCFSDIKVIHLGPDHPRLVGRDMQIEPVVLGHEVAMTVVRVGEHLQDRYHVGDRFIIQADIYHQGRGMAYGYVLQGGLSKYAIIGEEILHGDEGCYLLPVKPGTGYAEAALTEPWACVEAAYNIYYREGLKDGGVAWFLGCGEAGGAYRLSKGLDESSHPHRIVATNLPGPLANFLRRRAETLGIEWVALDDLAVATGWSPFDDIVALGATEPTMVEEAAKHLAKGGILNLVASRLGGKVHLDIGRLHYDHITFVGTGEADIAAAYQPIRSKLLPGGLAWFLGAAGPMGHMHVQRAIEMEGGPRKVVATNLRSPRILELERKFGEAARERGMELVCLTEERMGQEVYCERLWEESEGRGFDDIMVLAPSAGAIEQAADYLAPGGVMNVFAGLARGTEGALDVNAICAQGVRFIGSSGSAVADLRRMLALTESGAISPNRSVAAVAGIDGALDGLRAVAEGRFPGKVVVFPCLVGLPLIPLPELCRLLPNVYAKLGEGEVWTKEAEEELLTTLLAEEWAMKQLQDRIAIVTGAAQGLGEAIAHRLAKEGAYVVVADVNFEGAKKVAAAIEAQHGQHAMAVRADVTDEAQVEEMVQRTVEEFGRLDIMVANAGILISGEVADFPADQWRKVIEVNLVGYFLCAKHAARVMKEQKSGVIIQINSKSGKKGSYRNSAYAASKFGGIGLTQSLALELAPYNVRVNAVCPGNLLDSPLWVNSLYDQYAKRWGISKEDVRQRYIAQVPLGRGCTYDDVANVVIFLASDQAGYMTGQAINVTGGQEMR